MAHQPSLPSYRHNVSLTDRLWRSSYTQVAYQSGKVAALGKLVGAATLAPFVFVDLLTNFITDSLRLAWDVPMGFYNLCDRFYYYRPIHPIEELTDFVGTHYAFTRRCLKAAKQTLLGEGLCHPKRYANHLPSVAEAQATELFAQLKPSKRWEENLALFQRLMRLPRLNSDAYVRRQAFTHLVFNVIGPGQERIAKIQACIDNLPPLPEFSQRRMCQHLLAEANRRKAEFMHLAEWLASHSSLAQHANSSDTNEIHAYYERHAQPAAPPQPIPHPAAELAASAMSVKQESAGEAPGAPQKEDLPTPSTPIRRGLYSPSPSPQPSPLRDRGEFASPSASVISLNSRLEQVEVDSDAYFQIAESSARTASQYAASQNKTRLEVARYWDAVKQNYHKHPEWFEIGPLPSTEGADSPEEVEAAAEAMQTAGQDVAKRLQPLSLVTEHKALSQPPNSLAMALEFLLVIKDLISREPSINKQGYFPERVEQAEQLFKLLNEAIKTFKKPPDRKSTTHKWLVDQIKQTEQLLQTAIENKKEHPLWLLEQIKQNLDHFIAHQPASKDEADNSLNIVLRDLEGLSQTRSGLDVGNALSQAIIDCKKKYNEAVDKYNEWWRASPRPKL